MAEHPLVAYAHEHDNLIVTPHIGGCTLESMTKTEVFLAEKLHTVCVAPESPFRTNVAPQGTKAASLVHKTTSEECP